MLLSRCRRLLCTAPPVLAVLALAILTPAAGAQGGPPPAVRAAIQSVVRMLEATDEASLRTFIDSTLAPEYRASLTPGAMLAHLHGLRTAVGGRVDDIAVEREPDGLRLMLSGAHEVTLRLALDETERVTRLDLGEPVAPAAGDSLWANVTWESLPSAFTRAEAAGFSGVVLARRDGRELLRGAYGLADREHARRTALNTVYGIGSTPIDFTVTGILLLGQRGQLALDDSIGRYFADVPLDKRAMTLRHLLAGASGLPDFHGIAAEDWDPDLAWIDRATAVRRILAQPLRFAPGTGDEHSHSAFGLLAAVIEIVSGRSYADFVRAELLVPLGMERTGFYGETRGLPVEAFAVGYGASAVGLPNIPPNWGPTSWLVMGSGGMFSTLGDMERYYAAIESGQLLTGAWAQWQQGELADAGGSDRGFFIFRATNGRGSQVLLLLNGEGRAPEMRAITRAVARLAFAR